MVPATDLGNGCMSNLHWASYSEQLCISDCKMERHSLLLVFWPSFWALHCVCVFAAKFIAFFSYWIYWEFWCMDFVKFCWWVKRFSEDRFHSAIQRLLLYTIIIIIGLISFTTLFTISDDPKSGKGKKGPQLLSLYERDSNYKDP